MRIGKAGFQARIKGNLHIEFGQQQLTSYAGLELFRRFLRTSGFFVALNSVERRLKLSGDFRFSSLVLLVVGMLLIGARRLRHVEYIRDDPMLMRFARLSRVPSQRSLGRALRKLKYDTWPELERLNTATIKNAMQPLRPSRLTLDIDGSVLTTGLKAERAERGFNPHHRKNPSYYPIIATIAQTGHVVAHKNRSGNVHDSHQSAPFLRQTVRSVRGDLGFSGILEVRTDSAFFQRDFFKACDWCGIEYAIKVPMFPWLNLRGVVKQKNDSEWRWVDRKRGVQGLFTELPIKPWGRTERIAIYRKCVNHRPAKSRQLDMFNPDDGHWEYSVVATNKSLQLRALYDFMNGRGAQEKIIGELKSGFAFDCIPTNSYRANTAWQKFNILAYNLATSFQLATTATFRPSTLKRTGQFVIRSIRTLRFVLLNKAARCLCQAGTKVLRLEDNKMTQQLYADVEHDLAQVA